MAVEAPVEPTDAAELATLAELDAALASSFSCVAVAAEARLFIDVFKLAMALEALLKAEVSLLVKAELAADDSVVATPARLAVELLSEAKLPSFG